MMAWGECRYAREFTVRSHTKRLDEDEVCTSCAAILARIRAQIAGVLFPPDEIGSIEDRIAMEPRPQDPLADCAACGERVNGLTNQRAVLGTDGRWRFVHESSCRPLLHSA